MEGDEEECRTSRVYEAAFTGDVASSSYTSEFAT